MFHTTNQIYSTVNFDKIWIFLRYLLDILWYPHHLWISSSFLFIDIHTWIQYPYPNISQYIPIHIFINIRTCTIDIDSMGLPHKWGVPHKNDVVFFMKNANLKWMIELGLPPWLWNPPYRYPKTRHLQGIGAPRHASDQPWQAIRHQRWQGRTQGDDLGNLRTWRVLWEI